MKLDRGTTGKQRTVRRMAHRIRNAQSSGESDPFAEAVEVDESYLGGERLKMTESERKELTVSGLVGTTAVVGIRDRETIRVMPSTVDKTSGETLEGLVRGQVIRAMELLRDKAAASLSRSNHDSARHGECAYVRGQVQTNWIDSICTLKRPPPPPATVPVCGKVRWQSQHPRF